MEREPVFAVSHEMADIWKTVGEVDKQRRQQAQLSQKTFAQGPKRLTMKAAVAAAAAAAGSGSSNLMEPH